MIRSLIRDAVLCVIIGLIVFAILTLTGQP